MLKIKKPSRKITIILIAALIIAGGAGYYVYKRTNDSQIQNPGQFINLNPPTEEEKASGDKKKPEIIEQENKRNNTENNQASKKAVTPSITYAGQFGSTIEIGAYVGGIFEDGGTCTLTISKDGQTKIAEVAAVKNANSVDCPTMAIPRGSLVDGTWQVTVMYVSANYEGKSEIRNITLE